MASLFPSWIIGVCGKTLLAKVWTSNGLFRYGVAVEQVNIFIMIINLNVGIYHYCEPCDGKTPPQSPAGWVGLTQSTGELIVTACNLFQRIALNFRVGSTMNCKSSALLFFFAISNILLVPSISHAAVVEAHAVHVEGVANYFSIEDSKTYPVELNAPFREGDQVITGSDGKVEIEFETGALVLLDNDTDLTIQSLSKNDQGTLSVVFNLAFGLIKSSFSKLSDSDSIEYHTKTAISGIAGTPEHIVKADVTAEGVDRTNVYLLGEAGDEGSLFVRGSDPGMTEVTLFAGQGTTVLANLAPVIPFLLGPEILQSIGNLIFNTGGAAAGGGGAGAATAATATTAGISGTTMVLGGVALGGVAVAAGGSGGGGGDGDSSSTSTTGGGTTDGGTTDGGTTDGGTTDGGTSGGGETTTPTEQDELSGTWTGALVWGSPSDCEESGASFPLSCSITQSTDSLNGNCIADHDNFTLQGSRSGDGWAISASLPGEGGSGSLTGSISGISGNKMSGTWTGTAFCHVVDDINEGEDDEGDDHLVSVSGNWSATKN